MDKPECYGNYLLDACNGEHHKCKYGGECRVETNLTKGLCDCKYKVDCHTSRQWLQSHFQQEKEKCWFYQAFKKNEEGA